MKSRNLLAESTTPDGVSISLYEHDGALLDDPRVKVIKANAVERIKQGDEQSYDAVILDVDNGPKGHGQGHKYLTVFTHGPAHSA